MLTMDDMLAIVKPHNDKLVAESRANRLERSNAELRAALQEIRDQTLAVQHSQETRLDDIYDIAKAALEAER